MWAVPFFGAHSGIRFYCKGTKKYSEKNEERGKFRFCSHQEGKLQMSHKRKAKLVFSEAEDLQSACTELARY